jgi:hypothetical protein
MVTGDGLANAHAGDHFPDSRPPSNHVGRHVAALEEAAAENRAAGWGRPSEQCSRSPLPPGVVVLRMISCPLVVISLSGVHSLATASVVERSVEN